MMLAAASTAKAAESGDKTQIASGRAIAEQRCSGCHAIGEAGKSPNDLAPPFRTLSKKYPLDSLEEALAEGIAVGHAEMPQFEFEPNEIAALIAYLKHLQPREGK